MVYCIKQSVQYLLPWSTIAENYKTCPILSFFNFNIVINKYNSVFVSCSAQNLNCQLRA
jgi:hypothetical protein